MFAAAAKPSLSGDRQQVSVAIVLWPVPLVGPTGSSTHWHHHVCGRRRASGPWPEDRPPEALHRRPTRDCSTASRSARPPRRQQPDQPGHIQSGLRPKNQPQCSQRQDQPSRSSHPEPARLVDVHRALSVLWPHHNPDSMIVSFYTVITCAVGQPSLQERYNAAVRTLVPYICSNDWRPQSRGAASQPRFGLDHTAATGGKWSVQRRSRR
jgi:hypothetical protein